MVLRYILLLFGFIVLVLNHYIIPLPLQSQFIIFLSGIILLGIPHGAADLLVAIQNARQSVKPFSKINFFSAYIGKLLVFGLLLWLFPVPGVIIFIFLAAYHFGETDLFLFKTNTLPGKILVSSYGLVILSVILSTNIAEINQLIQLSGSTAEEYRIIWVIEKYKNIILSVSLVFFFAAVFYYFMSSKNNDAVSDRFLLQFALLVVILYNMPLLLGFTFYFIVWHSVLSLKNIIGYLRRDKRNSYSSIMKQIIFFAVIAMSGIVIAGLAGFMFMSNASVLIYTFAGLAILTFPHLHIMHDMYNKVRGVK